MRWRYKPSERREKRERVMRSIQMAHMVRADVLKEGRHAAAHIWGQERVSKAMISLWRQGL